MRLLLLLLLNVVATAGLIGCRGAMKAIAPSNVRNWTPEQAVLPTAEIAGQQVTVRNVRYCRYLAADNSKDGYGEEFIVQHEDRKYDLRHLTGVDFAMVPFEGMPRLAHTMLSFQFEPPDAEPQHLAVSVETRKEVGETYAAWKGSARQYELTYVLADERDVLKVRTNFRNEDVYLYQTAATPEQAQRLFIDIMGRVNELAARPEFYDTLGNNCTTNLVRHINRIHPKRIKYDYHVLLPGYSDELAYKEGLIVHHGTFEETKAKAYVNPKAWTVADHEDFSAAIRR